jgi:L-ascorbate metabolism protein UlaG (beta-lactamase superfamily)
MEAFAAYRDRQVPVIVKRGTGGAVRPHGFGRVIELDAGEQATIGPLTVTAEPAKHGVPENTYVLEGLGQTVFFGADTLRIPELDSIPERFPHLDLALLPINGLQIRPALNRRVVMNAEQAAELCGVLRPKVAVPIHYRFTAGPLRDRLLLRYDGTPERFVAAARSFAPGTEVRVLEPGQPLELGIAGVLASTDRR